MQLKCLKPRTHGYHQRIVIQVNNNSDAKILNNISLKDKTLDLSHGQGQMLHEGRINSYLALIHIFLVQSQVDRCGCTRDPITICEIK